MKLVQREAGSDELQAWLAGEERMLVSSLLLRTELLRATRRVRPDLLGRARALLDHITLLDVSMDVCERAGLLDPDGMRSLDAIHLASALTLIDELEGVVAYDVRLRAAAVAVGLTVIAPGDAASP